MLHPMPRVHLALSVALGWLLLAWPTLVRADDAKSKPPAGATNTPAEGVGSLSVGGDFAILDPDAIHPERDVRPGLNVEVVAAPRGWPVLVGLGAGFLNLGTSNRPGPVVAYGGDVRPIIVSTTRVSRSIELRHAELVLRVQPFWGAIRPYIDGVFGFAALWHSASLESDAGDTLRSHEEQRSVAVLYGVNVGVDWRIYSFPPGPAGRLDLVISTGIMRWYTGPMEYPGYFTSAGDVLIVTTKHESLAMWIPFISLAFTIDSRREARATPTTTASPR